MTIRKLGPVSLVLAGFLTGFAVAAGDDQPPVPYPEGYRRWAFLHTTVLGPQHGSLAAKKCEAPCTGGVMHFYANEKAMKGFKTGDFADGSILADEVLELHGTQNGGAKEGPRRGVGVMVRNSKLYATTGGWGYGQFKGDSKLEDSTAQQRQACFQCHESKKDNNYVFSSYTER